MWLSQKIKKDPEAKKTLKEISRLIRDYSDATRITAQKFWSAEIGKLLRPSDITYFGTIIIVLALGVWSFSSGKIKIADFQHWVELSLRISVPILVLGIALSNAIKGLDKESRFATEYLTESCRTIKFTCLTFLTVLAGFFCVLINDFTTLFASIPFLVLLSLAIGGTIACLMFQVYVIVETIRCMNPETSTKVASHYAARKLIHAFLKKAYIDVWMGKYSNLLETELKQFENICSPNKSYIKCLSSDLDKNPKESKYEINLPKEVDAEIGYRDYSLHKLKKINKSLKAKKAELYLTPNLWRTKECGTLYCEEDGGKLSKAIEKRKFCKFRKDKHIKAEDAFWNDHRIKLFGSICKAVEAGDVAQFREYLRAIESIFVTIRCARKDSLLRKYSEQDYNKYRFLHIYSSSMKWILQSKIEEAIRVLLIEEIANSIERQANDDIARGDWYTLDTFKWIFRDTYKLFEQHKNSSLWEERARIGRFYYYAESKLTEYESTIQKADKLQIQLTLHKGMINWLLVAIKNEDRELIKDLCNSARKLVFPDNKIRFTPHELVTQHFILCGKMLTDNPEIFKSLLFDEYDRSTEYGYDDLVDFYIENRKNNLRDCLREFCETDWTMSPLGGGGHGTPHYAFDGSDIDYTFIYLALLTISDKSQIRPVEFWHYNIKDKIAKIEKSARSIGIHIFKDKKDAFEKWMDGCDNLYKRQEEKRVADASLNSDKMSEYTDSFWAGYKERNTFLRFCLKSGYYAISDAAITKGRIRLPKSLFLETLQSGSVGRSCGSDVSSNRDEELINNIIKSTQKDIDETANNVESMLNKACQWLKEKEANETNGIIVYSGNTYIEGELYKNECYVPSWKNEKEKYFSGYYKSYPIITIHNQGEFEKCVALDLRGWKGIQVRTDIIEKEIFGNLNVREWREDEITTAIKKDPELKEEDRNKLKGTCAAEYELYWQLNKSDLPAQMTILMANEAAGNKDSENG